MLYCTVCATQFHTVLCSAVLCSAVFCSAVLCCVGLSTFLQFCAVLYIFVKYQTDLYLVGLYSGVCCCVVRCWTSVVECCTILRSVVQCCTMLCSAVLSVARALSASLAPDLADPDMPHYSPSRPCATSTLQQYSVPIHWNALFIATHSPLRGSQYNTVASMRLLMQKMFRCNPSNSEKCRYETDCTWRLQDETGCDFASF